MALLDELNHVLELRNPRVADTLVDPALARRYDSAFVPQSRQCNGHFFLVAAADAVGENVDFVAIA